MIANCPNCKPHEFQDKTYGYKMRVFNPCYKSNSKSIVAFRCTVCGIKIEVPKSQQKELNRK